MTNAAKEKPKMWGTSIVGFGSRHYKYESGREGDICQVGFASRKKDIVIYGLGTIAAEQPEMMAKLGVLTMGGSLTVNGAATCDISLDSDAAESSAAVADGVTLASGALLTLNDRGSAKLPTGTTFTVISNTSSAPIAGRFAGLADGGSITVGANHFQANYEGGDGNDLTLVVTP